MVVEVSCALASSEAVAVCLQGGVKGEGHLEEILAQEGLLEVVVFHHRIHLPVPMGSGPWAPAWLGKNHRQGFLPSS